MIDSVSAVLALWLGLCVHIDVMHLLVSLVHPGVGKLNSMCHCANLLSQYSSPERDYNVKWDVNPRTTALDGTWYFAVVYELVLSRKNNAIAWQVSPVSICQLRGKIVIKLLRGDDYVNVVGMWVGVHFYWTISISHWLCVSYRLPQVLCSRYSDWLPFKG